MINSLRCLTILSILTFLFGSIAYPNDITLPNFQSGDAIEAEKFNTFFSELKTAIEANTSAIQQNTTAINDVKNTRSTDASALVQHHNLNPDSSTIVSFFRIIKNF